MKTAEEYHTQYPIGSQWLLPVTICNHADPAHDDWDPRPIQLRPTTGKHYHRLWPHTDTLATLQPAATGTATTGQATAHPYTVVELLSGGYAVYKDTPTDALEVCIYWPHAHPNPRAAAIAECARLNAEPPQKNKQ